MPIEACRRFGATLLGAALVLSVAGVLPAWAQGDAPAKADRTWTDPPARGSAVTAVPEAPKTVEAPSPPKPLSAVEPKTGHSTDKSRVGARSASRSRVRIAAARVDVPHRRAHMVTVVRPPAAIHRPGIRMVTLRRSPFYDEAPSGQVRYGYTDGMRPVGRVDGPFETDRDHRIRQAREAGYAVVRARTLAFPDGSRLRSYRPYDPDDLDD